MPSSLIITNARVVYTCAGPAPRCGRRQNDAGARAHAAVAARDGVVTAVGSEADARASMAGAGGAVEIDARGGIVIPGFVDPHTHLLYAGDRTGELHARLAGASYAEIAAAGGGIVSTVAATRAADEDTLVTQARVRLDQMLACGTTTAEVKSGYGLDTSSELRMLRAIRRLDREQPVDLAATFMGAHETPLEYRGRRGEYVSLVIDEMIPAVQRETLAEWCDVFCETGVFTPEESREVLEAGRRAGLEPRIHADELAASGGAFVAAAVGARSADHLIFAERVSARAMAKAGVVATLLPIAAFYLKLGRFAPARLFIEEGVAVALATDVNPGGGFSPSMAFAMAIACFGMGLTVEEALVAATINAAYSLDRHTSVGSLEPGKLMDAVVIDGQLVDLLKVGVGSIDAVIKRGDIVWRRT